MTKSIMLVGVGGQGTILASKLLTTGLMEAGYDVKMSEIHGMSQRGGSVSSQVRYGDKVQAPVIEIGGADILVSFEIMEALRMLEYLKPDGKVIVNDYKIPSAPILSGKVDYPEGILDTLKASAHTIVINAAEIAKEVGNPRTMNIVLLGALIKAMKLTDINWEKIINDNVKPAFVEVNIKALKAGMDAIK